jgi:hypothetical protein
MRLTASEGSLLIAELCSLKGNILVAPPTVEQRRSVISAHERFLKKFEKRIFDLSSFPPILEVFNPLQRLFQKLFC